MSVLSQFTSGGGGIKSIQRGIMSIASGGAIGNQTITSVDMSKSSLNLLGKRIFIGSTDAADYECTLELTSSTNIRAQRGNSPSNVLYVSYEIVEGK